jgi:hypothetical protein
MNITRVKQRVATLISVVVFGYLVLQVLDRLNIVVWVHMPWYVLVLLGVGTFLAIDYLANRLLR